MTRPRHSVAPQAARTSDFDTRRPESDERLRTTAARFSVEGDLVDVAPFGAGHINDTYACCYRRDGVETRWVLQRINHEVFACPRTVMENIDRITRHLRRKVKQQGGDVHREVMEFVPTLDGALLLERDDATFWRMSRMIEGASVCDEPDNAQRVYAAAHAFGRFQQRLADLEGPRLHETIPGFHDTQARFDALMREVEADPCNRANGARAEIAFAAAHAGEISRFEGLRTSHGLPERIVHNDTKLNNVLFDAATGEALCVIDLDTVMPGLAVDDFGDMVRAGASTGAEDAVDLDTVHVHLGRFERMAKGYLDALRGTLTDTEKGRLALSAWRITFEQGIRFLTDHLRGDQYYKTHHEGHNLRRCRAQFALAIDMERRRGEMEAAVARYR